MKKRNQNVFIVVLLVFACIITIYSFKITVAGTGNTKKVMIQKLESHRGQSEYYYKPAGDTRLWHLINKYSEFDSENGECHNMSCYTFSSDSVVVINQYNGIQSLNQWDITLNDLLLTANNFNNQY
jgi:hypothetical protein